MFYKLSTKIPLEILLKIPLEIPFHYENLPPSDIESWRN